mmetsp:Transcript_1310/g.2875  ORF Transcript_1310/g.2875 Transcript_1310/m.2875 type:complete len:275 (-) Transcript_1310:123-947(-)
MMMMSTQVVGATATEQAPLFFFGLCRCLRHHRLIVIVMMVGSSSSSLAALLGFGTALLFLFEGKLVPNHARKNDAASKEGLKRKAVPKKQDPHKNGQHFLGHSAHGQQQGIGLEDQIKFAQNHGNGKHGAKQTQRRQFYRAGQVQLQSIPRLFNHQRHKEQAQKHAGCQQSHRGNGRFERRVEGLQFELHQRPPGARQYRGRNAHEKSRPLKAPLSAILRRRGQFATDRDKFTQRNERNDAHQFPRNAGNAKQIGPHQDKNGRAGFDHGVKRER